MVVETVEIHRLATDDWHRRDRRTTVFHERKQVLEKLLPVRLCPKRSDLAEYVHARFLKGGKIYYYY